MSVARFVLPAALGGVVIGVLGTDMFGSVPIAALALVGIGLVCAVVVLPGGMAPVGVVGVVLLAAAVGAWRAESSSATVGGPSSVVRLVDSQEHQLIGTVVDDPRPRGDRLQLVLGDLRLFADAKAARLSDRVLVWLPRGIDASSGDRLRIRSEVELAEDFDGFAYREYLERQGIGAIARARSAEVLPGERGFATALAAVRNGLLGGVNDLVPEPEAALGAGILLGVRASIAPEINDAFATAGLTHVVAISGWNIAIVAAIVAAIVSPLSTRPGGRWTTSIVAVATVGGYVMLTGASPSVVRAALMAGAMLVARLGGSRAHAASALALAALAMLLAAPPVLWDVGFQLSLLATAGLIWFGASVERRLPGWPAWIREPMALTLAAQLTTLPIVLVNFERLSLVAPIANVLVVPFVPVAMLFTAIASLVGVVDGAFHVALAGDVVAWLAGGAAWLTLLVIVSLGQAAASVPFAAVDVHVPAPFAVAWFPVLALGSWALRGGGPVERRPFEDRGAVAQALGGVLRPLPILACFVAILLVVTIANRPDGQLHVTTLSIGQGDSILVESPGGATMLVDGGPDPELTLRRIGANLPYFARRIDLLVLSHPHQDHVAGLVEVLDRFRIGAALHAGIAFENPSFERLLADASLAGIPVHFARAGQGLQLDAATSIRVLYPSEADAAAPLPEGDINNGSVVLELAFGGFTTLLTGDAEAPVEGSLVSRGVLGPVDVLKVGHHGSHSSSTPAFLAAVDPALAVISAGEDNEYGHPAPETLAALAGHAVLRTDLDGDVEVATDGRTFRIRTDAGWSTARPVRGAVPAGSIGPWPSPTDPPPFACSTRQGCRMGSWSILAVSPGWPWPPRGSWPRRPSRSTVRWSRPQPSSTTSTRSRPGAAAAPSMGSSARGGSRRRATRSSRCRSPPTPSPRCSTTIASRSAGRRSSWPSPTGTWHRRS